MPEVLPEPSDYAQTLASDLVQELSETGTLAAGEGISSIKVPLDVQGVRTFWRVTVHSIRERRDDRIDAQEVQPGMVVRFPMWGQRGDAMLAIVYPYKPDTPDRIGPLGRLPGVRLNPKRNFEPMYNFRLSNFRVRPYTECELIGEWDPSDPRSIYDIMPAVDDGGVNGQPFAVKDDQLPLEPRPSTGPAPDVPI